jgi:hypothetical protein
MSETTQQAQQTGTQTRYWAGVTEAVPRNVKGDKVIAAIKLPTTPDQVAHQYACVLEDGMGNFWYSRAAHSQGSFREMQREPADNYPAALARVFQESNTLFQGQGKVDIPGPGDTSQR